MPGKRNFEATITTRYGLPEKNIYEQVIDLVKKENLAKSRAQLLLVERGLKHVSNPEPLIKTVVKEVPIEKIKTVIKEVPKDKYSYCKDCNGRPAQKEGKSTEHVGIEEHVRGDDHITEQSASKGQAQNSGQGNPPSSPNNALGEKKSLKKEDGVSGWAVAGGLGIVGLLIYILVR